MNQHVHFDLAKLENEGRAALDKVRVHGETMVAAGKMDRKWHEAQTAFHAMLLEAGLAQARLANAGVGIDEMAAALGAAFGSMKASFAGMTDHLPPPVRVALFNKLLHWEARGFAHASGDEPEAGAFDSYVEVQGDPGGHA